MQGPGPHRQPANDSVRELAGATGGEPRCAGTRCNGSVGHGDVVNDAGALKAQGVLVNSNDLFGEQDGTCPDTHVAQIIGHEQRGSQNGPKRHHALRLHR